MNRSERQRRAYQEHKEKQLQNPEVRKAFEEGLDWLRLGASVAALRREMGVSQSELASRIDTSQPVISRLESGENVQLETVHKVAKALRASIVIELQRPEGDLEDVLHILDRSLARVSEENGSKARAAGKAESGGGTVTKSQFINMLANRTGLTKRKAAEALDEALGLIIQHVKRREKVRFPGFGTFEAKAQKRTERITQTGRRVTTPARLTAEFRAGKRFKDALSKR